jgi:hypothetical protein
MEKSCINCAYYNKKEIVKAFGAGKRFLHLIGVDIRTKKTSTCVMAVTNSTERNEIGFGDNFCCNMYEEIEK